MTGRTLQDEALVRRFQALGEETRFRIVGRLARGERCVCELQERMDAAQSRLSFHLKKLKDAGLVRARREGRWVYYSLVPAAVEELRSFLDELPAEEGEVWRPEGGDGEACCD